MRVNEIFGSIDGEGIRAGELATFIRLAGCNLRCTYCDTGYALSNKSGIEMSVNDIISKVEAIGYKNITLTGGEPLIQDCKELVEKLTNTGYEVNIETNGSIDISPYLMNNVIITMDYKTPESGEEDGMLTSNLKKLRECDVLKIVMSERDELFISNLLSKHKIQSYIYLSPIFNKIEPSELVNYLKTLHYMGYNTDKTKVQLQLHKYIWNPNKRGV